ncbi:Hypothetical Protein FCC1311_020802 [Hondaea fermentalgiana]|uniref:Uncharacterized protein n=1 Tax=Hondaea fermentalgiana TaxID=2315210 RepID=A0A2R5GCI2_9STRA|nr:Hypothetical Protein FCC1311_020802 [Hondaea fermentalgiana]|eukprot:GBG25861.1 Hypothetical Protein FCC1311_020802 [Hondaea fermentalgiana]
MTLLVTVVTSITILCMMLLSLQLYNFGQNMSFVDGRLRQVNLMEDKACLNRCILHAPASLGDGKKVKFCLEFCSVDDGGEREQLKTVVETTDGAQTSAETSPLATETDHPKLQSEPQSSFTEALQARLDSLQVSPAEASDLKEAVEETRANGEDEAFEMANKKPVSPAQIEEQLGEALEEQAEHEQGLAAAHLNDEKLTDVFAEDEIPVVSPEVSTLQKKHSSQEELHESTLSTRDELPMNDQTGAFNEDADAPKLVEQVGDAPQSLSEEKLVETGDMNTAAFQEELDKDTNMMLWLRADHGVYTDEKNAVQRWSDLTRNVDFVPTDPSTHVHEFFGHEDHASTDGEPVLSHDKLRKLPLVEFPCALESSKLKLTDEATLFFVLRPEAFLFGQWARGQRFFGHYPHGQFRFVDASPSFYSGGDRKLQRHALKSEIRAQHGLILLKYRLAGKQGVSVGVNHDPLFRVSSQPVQISKDSRLSIGGVDGGCGFRGGIAEVIVFQGKIADDKMKRVENYLEKRWWSDFSVNMDSVMQEVNNGAGPKDHLMVQDASIEQSHDKEGHQVLGSEKSSTRVCDTSSQDVGLMDFVHEHAPQLHPMVWLKASEGITLAPDGQSVLQWDTLHPGKLVSFSSPVHGRNLPRMQKAQSDSCLSFVEFGCSLTVPGMQLSAPMTAYVVLRPSAADPEATYQRLFGHFPNGGFLYDGQKAGFKSKHGFLFPRMSSKKRLRGADEPIADQEFVLAKYRLGMQSGVEVGTGNSGFLQVGVHHDMLFSVNQKLSVGGSNGGCEFLGGIGEILTFATALTDDHDRMVTQWLTRKWTHDAAEDGPRPVDASARCLDFSARDTEGILDWRPTGSFTKARYAWEDAVEQVRAQISGMTTGGAPLLALLKDRSRYLNDLRDTLFGDVCDDEEVTVKTTKTSVGSDGREVLSEATSKRTNDERPACDTSPEIMNWKAPEQASIDDKRAWEDALEKAHGEVQSFQMGGKALETFLKKLVRGLRDTRSSLFGKLCGPMP